MITLDQVKNLCETWKLIGTPTIEKAFLAGFCSAVGIPIDKICTTNCYLSNKNEDTLQDLPKLMVATAKFPVPKVTHGQGASIISK
jgi:hypothetical protein